MEKEVLELAFRKIEYLTGYELPEEFKSFYRNDKNYNIKNITFMGIDEIINAIVSIDDLDLEELKGIKIKVEPEKSIIKECYLKTRVPFISDNLGNYIGIDFEVDENGVSGQIINYGENENLMRVFAYTFKDFIDGVLVLENYNGKPFITDYLLSTEFDKKSDNMILNKLNLPQKVKIPEFELVENYNKETEKIYNRVVEFKEEYLKDIFSYFQKVIFDVKVDLNVLKYHIENTEYKIINYDDYYNVSVDNLYDFWNIYNEYDKAEIKKFSFDLKIKIEENIGDNKKIIYTEFLVINIEKETIYIKYKTKFNNKNFEKIYKDLCNYFDKIIELEG